MNDLVAILSRFRKEKIALAADIESMYYQVQVSPRDRDSLRFLWGLMEILKVNQYCIE